MGSEKKDKYKVIQCFLVWNEEDDCAASKPLWSEKSAQEFANDMNRFYGNNSPEEGRV